MSGSTSDVAKLQQNIFGGVVNSSDTASTFYDLSQGKATADSHKNSEWWMQLVKSGHY